ncbi:unnamed protein product, partial [Timema podura]|nr:unnamed protein product [Timema podura]
TPLHFAAMRKQGETSVATVALLVMNGADITIKRTVDDSTPLHCALGVSCQPLLVEELLKSPDRIVAANQRMKGDRSPLELVARSETHLLQCQGSVFKMLAEYTEREDVDQALSTMETYRRDVDWALSTMEGREYHVYTDSLIDTPRWTGLSAPWRDVSTMYTQIHSLTHRGGLGSQHQGGTTKEGREYHVYTDSLIDTPRWTGLSAPRRDVSTMYTQIHSLTHRGGLGSQHQGGTYYTSTIHSVIENHSGNFNSTREVFILTNQFGITEDNILFSLIATTS